MTDAERADNDIIRFILSRCTDETEDHIKVIAKSILSALTAAGRVIVDAGELARLQNRLKNSERSRRFSSEQWARAGREALDGKSQNLRNRIELNGMSVTGTTDPLDGSPLLIIDEKKLISIDERLAAAHALLRKAREGLERVASELNMTRLIMTDKVTRDLAGESVASARAITAEIADTLGETRDHE